MDAVANPTSTMTIRQLRVILFELADQEMTIKELRKKLYDAEEQDKAVKIDVAFWWNQGIE